MENSMTVQYTNAVHLLVGKARSMVRDLDPQNDLTFIRVRSKKNEILIAPGQETIITMLCKLISKFQF